MLNLKLSNIYSINMESKKEFMSIITHSLALGMGIFIGVVCSELHRSERLNSKNPLIKDNKVYMCDAFDSNGNPMIINFVIYQGDDNSYRVLFEEEQDDISFVITQGGKEVANIEKFSGKEYKFIN